MSPDYVARSSGREQLTSPNPSDAPLQFRLVTTGEVTQAILGDDPHSAWLVTATTTMVYITSPTNEVAAFTRAEAATIAEMLRAVAR